MDGRRFRMVMVAGTVVIGAATFGACGNGENGSENGDVGPQSTDAGVPDTVSFSKDVQTVFTRRCVSCHSAALESANGELNLESGASHAELVNVDANCGAMKRVVPGDLEASALWLKTAGEPGCGAEMPTGSPLKSLAPREFSILEKWIEQGAPNN